MKKTYYFFILFIVPFLARCQPQSLDEKLAGLLKGSVETINCNQATALISNGSNVKVYDTRSTEEFNVSAIKNADFIEYDNFDPLTIKLPNKTDTLIFYCTVGYRSEKITEKLQKEGYTHVSNFYGGIFSWKNEGGVVVNSKNQATDKVHTYNKKWSQWLLKGEKVW